MATLSAWAEIHPMNMALKTVFDQRVWVADAAPPARAPTRAPRARPPPRPVLPKHDDVEAAKREGESAPGRDEGRDGRELFFDDALEGALVGSALVAVPSPRATLRTAGSIARQSRLPYLS